MSTDRPDHSLQVSSVSLLLEEHETRKQQGHQTQSYDSFKLSRYGFIDMVTGETVYITAKDLRETAQELEPAIQGKIFGSEFRSTLFG